MSVCPDQLIEKFASMLEEGEGLDSSAFADRAIEIIAMISVAPDLSETLGKINNALYAIFHNADDIKFNALKEGTQARACAASELRALKQNKPCEVLH
ncbi:MAG: hypothetical protein JSR17_12005 [Proteobacteria bacterium]|nr:hypothetical protein [Pseudomonadota bacterium]